MELLDVTRYEPDVSQRQVLWDAERHQNEMEGNSTAATAAM